MKWAIKEPLKQRFVCCAASMVKKQRCNLPGALTRTDYGCSMGVATAGNLGGPQTLGAAFYWESKRFRVEGTPCSPSLRLRKELLADPTCTNLPHIWNIPSVPRGLNRVTGLGFGP